MSNSDWCRIFVTENKTEAGSFSVQFQFPAITMTLVARDLLFAKRIIAFVTETRCNPVFRDAHIGGGVYRHIPEKSIDLSSSFPHSRVLLVKNGEYESGFVMRIEPCSTFSGCIAIHDELEAMLDALREIADDYEAGQKDT